MFFKIKRKRIITGIILILAVAVSCKSETKITSTEKNSSIKDNHSVTSTKIVNDDKQCFQFKDSIRIKEILKQLTISCNEKNNKIEKLLSTSFSEDFESFPCKLYLETKKSRPNIQITPDGDDCEEALVEYNFLQTIIEDGEEYHSEKYFSLIFIKNSEGFLFVNSFGAAG